MDILYNPTKYNLNENLLIEKAIAFLVDEYRKTGNNSKPVIFHCTRVASLLVQLNYDANTIAAAYLHDLIEDTEVTYDQIEKEFGSEIANIVGLTTFDSKIEDKRERYKEVFGRIASASDGVIALKAADILDNSTYYDKTRNLGARTILMEKMNAFIDICKKRIPEAPITKSLVERYDLLKGRFIKRGFDNNGNYVEKHFKKIDDMGQLSTKLICETNILIELWERGHKYVPEIMSINGQPPYVIDLDDYYSYKMKKIEGITPESTPENWKKLGKIAADLHTQTMRHLLNLNFIGIDISQYFEYDRGEYLDKLNYSPKGIIHTDLGMHNILLQEDGEIRLIDWDDVGHGSIYIDLGAPLLCCFIENGNFLEKECDAFYREYFTESHSKDIDLEIIYITGMLFLVEYIKYNPINRQKLDYAKTHRKEIISCLQKAIFLAQPNNFPSIV